MDSLPTYYSSVTRSDCGCTNVGVAAAEAVVMGVGDENIMFQSKYAFKF